MLVHFIFMSVTCLPTLISNRLPVHSHSIYLSIRTFTIHSSIRLFVNCSTGPIISNYLAIHLPNQYPITHAPTHPPTGHPSVQLSSYPFNIQSCMLYPPTGTHSSLSSIIQLPIHPCMYPLICIYLAAYFPDSSRSLCICHIGIFCKSFDCALPQCSCHRLNSCTSPVYYSVRFCGKNPKK